MSDSGAHAVSVATDEDRAAIVALSGLPGLTPGRFWSLLSLAEPAKVWQLVCQGKSPRSGRARDAADQWPAWTARVDPPALLARHQDRNVSVHIFGSASYPSVLLDDPDPPPVLYQQGPHRLDDRVRVAIVGTRKCTFYGQQVAQQLGLALARRGVDVVSGLASGIDAAAHAGAIEADAARTIAVVAGGVDHIYPKRNRGLFATVASSGALLSEWPLGATPMPWRFPARNRLVAALSAAVVVVESPVKGGSMYTVDEAMRRNREIFAVPGSILSPVSAGTNRLVAEGAFSLHVIDHLLDAVAPLPTARGDQANRRTHKQAEPSQLVLGTDSWLLELVGWEPADLDSIVMRSGRSPGDVALEAERLIASGALRRRGALLERVA